MEGAAVQDLRLENIPAMPAVATRVIQLVGQEGVQLSELASTISTDAALTARVLQIANSSFYGFSRKVDTVKEAVALLGLAAIKSLVIMVARRNIYKEPGLLENLLWDHSVSVALGANHLAKSLHCCDADEAFVAGLMHDVGKSVLNNSDHLKFLKLFQKAYSDNDTCDDFLKREEEFFSINHLACGKLVAEKWNLSDGLGSCLALHNLPSEETLKEAPAPSLLATVTLANLISHRLGHGLREPKEDEPLLESDAAAYLKLDEQRLETLIEEIGNNYFELKESFKL